MLEENDKERLRTLTVEVLLALRAEYLRTPQANILKHWDMIQTRMRSASRTCATPEEWATSVARRLQIGTLGVASARCLTDLVHVVTEKRCASDWLDLVERETGYLMAMARLCAEQRKEAKEAARGNEAV